MHYLVLFLTLLTVPAMAQVKIDDGVRSPQSMVVSGNSVIDDESVDDDIEIPESLSEEEQELLSDGTGDLTVDFPVEPSTPATPVNPAIPAPNVKQVVKPYQNLKVRRAIADDRIDDSYVQEMIKNNNLFTPNQKK